MLFASAHYRRKCKLFRRYSGSFRLRSQTSGRKEYLAANPDTTAGDPDRALQRGLFPVAHMHSAFVQPRDSSRNEVHFEVHPRANL